MLLKKKVEFKLITDEELALLTAKKKEKVKKRLFRTEKK